MVIDLLGVELPNKPPDGAGAGCPHKDEVDGAGAVAVVDDDKPPRPRGGGLVGAGVEAIGGVEGTAPPKRPPPPPLAPPKADVVDDDEEAAAAVPAPKTVVVLFPQVTTIVDV